MLLMNELNVLLFWLRRAWGRPIRGVAAVFAVPSQLHRIIVLAPVQKDFHPYGWVNGHAELSSSTNPTEKWRSK
jgi:hypothetical protein